MPIPTDEERIGSLVAERYRIEAVIGRGGMGTVFGGSHAWTGRQVAIKILKPGLVEDAAGVRRFLQEARAAAQVHHPNVVDVLDMGAEEDGAIFLVLERLNGQSLGEILMERERLDAVESLEIILPIVRAQVAAHAQGVLHRDIKPDNIFVSRDGDGATIPKLLDFGMAKVSESSWGQSTATGTLIGTTFYMAPERAEGLKTAGAQADVWSTAAVLFRCLAGRPPFVGRNPTTVLLAITRGEREHLSQLAPIAPAPVVRAIEDGLVLDCDQRHATMAVFLSALLAAAEESGIAVKDPSAPQVTGGEESDGSSGETE